jgi:hypothetical protein
VISKKVAGKFGPRLNGGHYVLVGRNEGTGARGGVIAAFEQPVVQESAQLWIGSAAETALGM